MSRPSVVVIGAGLAGLRTADLLVQRGAGDVVVLEARDRVGGRTLSRTFGRGTFDLGGQWIGPTQHRAHALARELGLTLFPTHHEGDKIVDLGGRIARYGGSIPRIDPLSLIELQLTLSRLQRKHRRVPTDAPQDAPDAARDDATTLGAYTRAHVRSPKVRALFEASMRVVFGADLDEISLLHFLFYAEAAGGLMPLIEVKNGAQETRFAEGTQALSLRLAARLGSRVRLGQPVRRVVTQAGSVTVHADGGTFEADRVVVAVPPVLARTIVFEPSLPPARRHLMERTFVGRTIKCMALYDRPFWRDRGLNGEVVTDQGPLAVAFDNVSYGGAQAALLGFSVGRPAGEHARKSAAERRHAVLERFARWYGPEALSPTEYVEHDWSEEPWSRGCPISLFGTGALAENGAALRAPTGLVHWAGTETARQWHGFLEGALESAERVVTELA